MPAKTKTSSTGNSNEGRKKNAPAKSPAAEDVTNILEQLQDKNTPKDTQKADDTIEITLLENPKPKRKRKDPAELEDMDPELSEEAKAAFAYFRGEEPDPKKPKAILGMGLEALRRSREEQLQKERRLQKENAELRMKQENADLKLKIMEQKQELLTLQLEQTKRDMASGKDPEIQLQGKKKSSYQDLNLEALAPEGNAYDEKEQPKSENSKLMSMMRDMKDTLVQTQLDVAGQTFHWTQTRYICLMAKITTTVLGHTNTHNKKICFPF